MTREETLEVSHSKDTFLAVSGSSIFQRRGVRGRSDEDDDGHIHVKRANKLITFDELPDWFKDNQFIRHGYRPISYSAASCFASLAYIHNETFNIYSHMIPALVLLLMQGIVYQTMASRFPNAPAKEYLVFAFLLATAFTTMCLSSTYHTMMNHSEPVSRAWLRIDFVGIVLLTIGKFVSGVYVVFYCDPALQSTYWTMILTLGALTTFLVVHPRYQGQKWRTLRTTAFVATALSGFVPLAHGCLLYGRAHMWMASGLPYYLLEGALLGLGVACYASRSPEALWPGRFDIWGCSHNVFHVLVVLAAAVHVVGVWESLAWNHENQHCRV